MTDIQGGKRDRKEKASGATLIGRPHRLKRYKGWIQTGKRQGEKEKNKTQTGRGLLSLHRPSIPPTPPDLHQPPGPTLRVT